MRCTALTGFVVMIGLAAVLPQTLTAQNEEADGTKSQTKEFRGPLPFYFGKLGLSEAQKEKLYAIQDAYDEKIAVLEKQIEDLKSERDKSMETLFTPGQKLRLQELREEARLKQKKAARAETKTGNESVADP